MITVRADQYVVSGGVGNCGRELPKVSFAFLGSGRVVGWYIAANGVQSVTMGHGESEVEDIASQ